jgi:hypothetical protein
MPDHCGTTTEEGNAVCVPGTCTCSSPTQNNEPAPSQADSKGTSKPLITKLINVVLPGKEKSHVEENS